MGKCLPIAGAVAGAMGSGLEWKIGEQTSNSSQFCYIPLYPFVEGMNPSLSSQLRVK